jgi:hypothetical protein
LRSAFGQRRRTHRQAGRAVVTPEQKYEALKARLEDWASGENVPEPLTENGRRYREAQQDLAAALLEYANGLEQR